MDHQRIGAQMANIDLVIEILADFLVGNLFRGLVVVGDKVEHGIQVVLLRGLRQAVVLHVGHEALTQRSAAAFQNFGPRTFLRSFRHIIPLSLVWFRRNIFKISGMSLVLGEFMRNVSTLFGFLTIVRYGMGVDFTHVRCLSRSLIHSGWVDKVRILIPVAAGIAFYYIMKPGDFKTRTRRFSSISTVARDSWNFRTLRLDYGFRATLTTFEPETVLAA